jgi:predicted nuclease of predicted toxin-antitoxin system
MRPSASERYGAAPLPDRARLLFDENLAGRLVSLVGDEFPASAHVLDLGLGGATDEAIWPHAREHGFVLVTKDEDLHRGGGFFRVSTSGSQ